MAKDLPIWLAVRRHHGNDHDGILCLHHHDDFMAD